MTVRVVPGEGIPVREERAEKADCLGTAKGSMGQE